MRAEAGSIGARMSWVQPSSVRDSYEPHVLVADDM
jgi:hypothetical protein